MKAALGLLVSLAILWTFDLGGSVLQCIQCDDTNYEDPSKSCTNATASNCTDANATSCRGDLGDEGYTFVKKECSSFAVQCDIRFINESITCVCGTDGCNNWTTWKDTPDVNANFTTSKPSGARGSVTGRIPLLTSVVSSIFAWIYRSKSS